jgi:Ca2+-binding RTX toxin-like protein
MRILRTLLVATIVVSASIQSAHAGVVAECVFDEGTGVVTVTPLEDVPSAWIIRREGDAITAGGDTCGGATVTSVDAIEVDSASGIDVEVWLDGGPFAPGKTVEVDGSSEIEFTFSGGASTYVTFRGTTGADHVSAGMTVGDDLPALNLNADEAIPDVDVAFLDQPEVLWVLLLEGDDSYSEWGIGDEAQPLWAGAHVVAGGPGDDVVSPAMSDEPNPIFSGGAGTDTLSFRPVPTGCDVSAYGGTGLLAGSLPTCHGGLSFGRFERFEGHAGVDWLGGDGGDDVVLAYGGDDLIFADPGDDTLNGGRGRDVGIWIQTGRVRVDLRDGTALLGTRWTQTVRGIEDLVGSALNDVLIGNGADNTIQGEGGDDLLLGKGGIDELYGGDGHDTCDVGLPGAGEFANC